MQKTLSSFVRKLHVEISLVKKYYTDDSVRVPQAKPIANADT